MVYKSNYIAFNSYLWYCNLQGKQYMHIFKKMKDSFIKFILGSKTVPQGLFELSQYCRMFGGIHFDYKKEGGEIIAISSGFKLGSIVTSGKNEKELDKNIKDAILTFFEIPSSYRKEAKICKVGDGQREYAIA